MSEGMGVCKKNDKVTKIKEVKWMCGRTECTLVYMCGKTGYLYGFDKSFNHIFFLQICIDSKGKTSYLNKEKRSLNCLLINQVVFYSSIFKPCNEKSCSLPVLSTKVQISLCLYVVRSVPLLFAALRYCTSGAYVLNSRSLANFCSQGCHGQGKKSGKQNFFQVREKSGNFNFSQGNYEKVVKVMEKSGNLRIFKKVQS